MTTEAGRRLLENLRYLDISWRDTDGSELNAAMVAAIEAEARDEGYALAVEMERAVAATERAALLAELEAGVEGLRKPMHGNWDSGWDAALAAVLALLEEK